MPRSIRLLSLLLFATTAFAGYACAKGTQVETTGGEGGAGGAGDQGGPTGSTSTSSGPGAGGMSASASSSGSSGATTSTSAASGGPDGGSDGSGGGGPVTFMVVRVGDGVAALTAMSAAVFLEERALDGTLVAKASNPLPLPTSASGANQPLTLAGSAGSEGALARSGNGNYVTLGGYAVAPGMAGVALSAAATVNRVVGRVDANGNVDTSTRLNTSFDTANIRGAVTNDGTAFWASGNGTGATGGVHYAPLGAASGTQILAAPNNSRCVAIFAGQLYGSSGAAAMPTVFTVGAGLPTTAGQVGTTLSGIPGSGGSPYAFVMFDRDPVVAGMDTLYIADDSAQALGGGVQKWTFNGLSWTKAATFGQGIATGVRGIAGAVTGNNVTLIATTSENSQNNLVVYVDDGGASPMGQVVATAAPNTAFRGVAISPQ